MRVRLLAIGRSIWPIEGTRRTVAEIRAEVIAKIDEAAYQSFIGHFRLCQDCRRFVCPGCWNRSWSSCKSYVSRAMARMSPTLRRLRLGLRLAVIAGSVLLMAVGFASVVAMGAMR